MKIHSLFRVRRLRTLGIILIILVAISGIYLYFIQGHLPGTCASVPREPFAEGSQGYRIWSGDTLKSFNHHGKRICVPKGWEALGAQEIDKDSARYPKGKTGVLIRTKDFPSRAIPLVNSSYEVTMRYPADTSNHFIEQEVLSIQNAFNRVGKIFGDTKGARRLHTVLVTAGIAGDTIAPGTRVYPDPGPDMSILVRTPDYSRGEELLIHAVAHLYNRSREDLTAYQKQQAPFPPGDFQELEATWTETAFMRNDEWRRERLEYLYNVHTAVRENNFSLIQGPPFDDEEAFNNITESAIVPAKGDYIDYQYGHYILAPLVMVATEGLLQERMTGTNMERTLTNLHMGHTVTFLEELEKILSKEDTLLIKAWAEGKATIPRVLVFKGAHYYDQQ